MTSQQFAAYCRRIRECNSPAGMSEIRAELDQLHPQSADSKDSDALVKLATLKRMRLLESN